MVSTAILSSPRGSSVCWCFQHLSDNGSGPCSTLHLLCPGWCWGGQPSRGSVTALPVGTVGTGQQSLSPGRNDRRVNPWPCTDEMRPCSLWPAVVSLSFWETAIPGEQAVGCSCLVLVVVDSHGWRGGSQRHRDTVILGEREESVGRGPVGWKGRYHWKVHSGMWKTYWIWSL